MRILRKWRGKPLKEMKRNGVKKMTKNPVRNKKKLKTSVTFKKVPEKPKNIRNRRKILLNFEKMSGKVVCIERMQEKFIKSKLSRICKNL